VICGLVRSGSISALRGYLNRQRNAEDDKFLFNPDLTRVTIRPQNRSSAGLRHIPLHSRRFCPVAQNGACDRGRQRVWKAVERALRACFPIGMDGPQNTRKTRKLRL
jgi:hypothetical protein